MDSHFHPIPIISWVSTIGESFYDINDTLLLERGHYDSGTAHLDEATTTVYEMHVALSADAATATMPVSSTIGAFRPSTAT